MKFITLACLSVFALATVDQKAVQKVVHLSLADIPEKIVKVHNFFKPHLEDAHKCFTKNAKQLAQKAKPHVQKACKDWKAKEKQHVANIKKFHGNLKKKCDEFGKSLGSMKDIKLQVIHKSPEGQACKKTCEPTQSTATC